MKKQLRTNPVLKAVAVILLLVLAAGGFWASLFTLYKWDDIWTGAGYYDSNNYYANLYNRLGQVQELARLTQEKAWDGGLSYLDQQRLENLKEMLAPEKTNFRFQLLDNATGKLVYGNLKGWPMGESVYRVHTDAMGFTRNGGERREDYMSWDGEQEYYLLHLVLPDGSTKVCTPEETQLAAQYGWFFDGGYSWEYDSSRDSRVVSVEFAVEYGVTNPTTVEDEFTQGAQEYLEYAQYLPAIALLALVLDAAAVLLFVFLCLGAGRRREREGVVLNGFDRIPLDALAILEFFALALLLNAGDSMAWAFNTMSLTPDLAAGLSVISLGIAGCVEAFLLTLVVRIKAGTVGSNTLVWMLCKVIYKGCRRISASWPLTGRMVGWFLLYLLGTFLTALTVFLIPVYQGVVLWLLCRWTIQWKRVRTGTEQITGGNPEYKIDTEKMYRDLKIHAEQLNNLGSAISTAVDERMKSERFKAELITNVSHDLKTPLTSIINYVDLLKKEEISDPKAAEYIEVLDRKSQRLKKLTEDLVEASKASTGSLSVNRERLGVVQLVQQALGEFEEKFARSCLTPVLTAPAEEAYVEADGRHLWRIIDNLLSNCNKYALEGTRIYLDVIKWEGQVTLSVKNISRQQLNIPAEQLMERFVRGEESRSTEGSGLGLSIARSLAELQGGTFRLDVDGDLFKAAVSFPESEAPTQIEA